MYRLKTQTWVQIDIPSYERFYLVPENTTSHVFQNSRVWLVSGNRFEGGKSSCSFPDGKVVCVWPLFQASHLLTINIIKHGNEGVNWQGQSLLTAKSLVTFETVQGGLLTVQDDATMVTGESGAAVTEAAVYQVCVCCRYQRSCDFRCISQGTPENIKRFPETI